MSDPSFQSFDAATRTLVLRHVAAMIARVQSFFAQHQDDHLKRLRAHFFEQVDIRPHTTQAQNLRTAGVMLDKQAPIFNRAFQAALRESIEDEVEAVMPGALRVLRPATDMDELSGPSSMALLDVDEIERHLLVDRVAQRFNSRYEAPLKALTVSVGALLRQDEFALVDNPFRPASLIRAFLIAWHSSAFDPAAAEDFVSVLEPQCSIDWTPLYTDLTAMLVRAGYSAKPMHRIKRTAGSGGAGGDSAAAPLSGDPACAPGPGSDFASACRRSRWWHRSWRTGRRAIGRRRCSGRCRAWRGPSPIVRASSCRSSVWWRRWCVRRLGWSGRCRWWTGRPAAALGGIGGGAAHAPADPALMGFLGGLQAGAGTSQFPEWARGQDIAGHNVLRQMREREEVQRATEIDRGTVDALAEVFDYVFADKSIPLQLKFVIGRLQIPVLKAALIDRAFFLSGEHPARQLVDALAAAAVGWAPESGETDPLYQCIDGVVGRVLAEFEADLQLFRTLLADVQAFVQANQQQAEVRIKPAASQEQLKEAREAALVHADGVVHQCIHALPIDEPLPPFLLPFLTTQWRDVLAHAWLVIDSEPARWDLAVKTMDDVIWSTRPRFQGEERGRLMALLPKLVPRLDSSLDAIGWKGPERDEFTKRLIGCHMKAIRTPKAGPAPVESGPGELETQVGRAAIQALDQRLAPAPQKAPDAFDAMAQGLERGMWFDLEHDGDALRRYRLGWISPQRSRMLFTNRDGFEAFVRSQREVAALLREGRLTIIDQQPIVARALDQIMAQDDPVEAGPGGPATVDLQLQ